MRNLINGFALLTATWSILTAAAFGQDTGAVASGNWNDPTIWTTTTVPNSSNNVYIGSTYPTGSVAVATVTLTQAQSANNVYLGNGSGNSGTLDLGNNALTISNTLYIGTTGGGTGNLLEGANGSFTAQGVIVTYGNSLTFGANDVVSNLELDNKSSATIPADANGVTGNVTNNLNVYSGSTLNVLSSNLFPNGTLEVRDTGSTLNLNGQDIFANTILLGWNGGQAVTLNRGSGGTLETNNLYVGNTTFNLQAGDYAGSFYLHNATSTLYSTISLLHEENGSSATTTAGGNVSSNVEVFSGSTLNLGANMSLFNSLDARDTGTTINLNGYSLTASSAYLGWNDGQAVTLNRGAGGTLDVLNLYVGNNTLNVLAGDNVSYLDLHNATSTLYSSINTFYADTNSHLTTTATGSITGFASLSSGSTMDLGANLNLGMNFGSNLLVNSGSTLNAHGFGITADSLFLGDGGNSAGTLNNNGAVNVNQVYMYNGSTLNLHGGDHDVINNQVYLYNSSAINVYQTDGMGLTFNGASSSDLTIDRSQNNLDTIHLIFTPNSSPNWDFRWQDPSNGNWISTIEGLISSGEITISGTSKYTVNDRGGYTYIDGIVSASVPEPSSLVLACLAVVGVTIGMASRRRRRQTGP